MNTIHTEKHNQNTHNQNTHTNSDVDTVFAGEIDVSEIQQSLQTLGIAVSLKEAATIMKRSVQSTLLISTL